MASARVTADHQSIREKPRPCMIRGRDHAAEAGASPIGP
jgi:hypothetical protein